MNVLTSITVLGFLIFFHELGHFLAAILQGIYVDGFSIGFGPSIIQKKYKDITLFPKNVEGKGTIGAQLQPNIRKETKKTKNIFELFKYTNNEFSSLLVKTIQGYKGLITNFSSTAQQLSGPVKIVEIGAQLSQQGGTGILLFAALISINLAVLNSLPLPLLDGGQLVFTLIEGFRGKPVPVKVQMVVTQSSFFLLVGLSVLLIIRDTSQLLIVQRLLNQ